MDSNANQRFISSVAADDLQLVERDSQVDSMVGNFQCANGCAPGLVHESSSMQVVLRLDLCNVIEDQIVINLGELQGKNVNSTEVIFSTAKMVFELCCKLGGITSKDELQAKGVIEEILCKYRARYRAIAEGNKAHDRCESNDSDSSKDINEDLEDVSSGEIMRPNGGEDELEPREASGTNGD